MCVGSWRKTGLGLGVLLLAAVALVWFLPARWALPWITPRLQGITLRQVHGLLWNGGADQVGDKAGHDLGRVQWQLSRRALLGRLVMHLDVQGPALDLAGTLRRTTDHRDEWRDVRARIDLAALASRGLALPGAPGGELSLTAERALLQNGWPLALEATGRWRGGTVRDARGQVALGDWSWQAQARDGVMTAQFGTDGDGPLHGTGQLQASLLGWRVQATLDARHGDEALRQWLGQWGTVDGDGVVHIERRGGLAAR